MKKQVLFVIDSLNCGGAEKSLVSLLPLLDYDNICVDLLMFSGNGLFKHLLPKEVNIIQTCAQTKRGILQRIKSRTALLLNNLPWCKHRHPSEIYWKNNQTSFLNIQKTYDLAIAYQQGVPTFFVANNVLAKRKASWVNVDLKKAGYDEEYCRKYYDKYDSIIAVSDLLHDMLNKSAYCDHNKVTTIYDIINPQTIHNLSKETEETFSASHKIKITTVGRLSKQKNYLLAIDTAKEIKNRGIDFEWIFVGDGPERDNIEKAIANHQLEENIRLAGLKLNPYPFIANCDIYVQTSSFEGYCITLAEARILHKPVVTTNFSVAKDQIIDGINGLIAEMDATDIANKIELLLNDEGLKNNIVENCQKEENLTAITESKKVNNMILG